MKNYLPEDVVPVKQIELEEDQWWIATEEKLSREEKDKETVVVFHVLSLEEKEDKKGEYRVEIECWHPDGTKLVEHVASTHPADLNEFRLVPKYEALTRLL